MKIAFLIAVSCTILVCCNSSKQDLKNSSNFLTDKIPDGKPIPFLPDLTADNFLIHRGIFSNDLMEYYFTISDTIFSNFHVKVIRKKNGKWTEPNNAFFNSDYNDHGMSFSPDGNTLVFSSTRPVQKKGIPDTWHIWRSVKQGDDWSEPEFINIPNLHDKLTSHPTLTNNGTLYFHSSNLDYSEMAIYYSNQVNGIYQDAKKLNFEKMIGAGYCTPYISSSGKYLIFAEIGNDLELYICKLLSDNKWSKPTKLPSMINQNGQGNPYLTPDSRYLFFTTENNSGERKWNVNWIDTGTFLEE